jgi:hypothetical protein
MSVATAYAHWQAHLVPLAAELGTPVICGALTSSNNWLDQFLASGPPSPRENLTVVHKYQGVSSDATGQAAAMVSYLNQVHNKYGGRIWLTEFGMITFTTPPTYPSVAQAQAFMSAVVPQLRALPWLERFAWYPMAYMPGIIANDPNTAHITLVDNTTGALTALGTTYSGL